MIENVPTEMSPFPPSAVLHTSVFSWTPPILQSSYLFRTATFSEDKLIWNKDVNRRATSSNQIFLRIIKLFITATFSSKEALFQNNFFREAVGRSIYAQLVSQGGYFLKRSIFYNIIFQKRDFFLALLTFHRYISYLSVSYLESSTPVTCNINVSFFLWIFAQNHIAGVFFLISWS